MSDPSGIFQDAWKSQFTGNNRVKGDRDPQENVEGPISDSVDELELSLKDEELITLKKSWEQKWENNDSRRDWEKRGEKCEKYYLGVQDKDKGERLLQDNVIFEAVETLKPVAGRQNPEPVVTTDNTELGMSLSGGVKKMLVFQADQQKLRMQGKQVLYYWMLYSLGVAKVGWDMNQNDIDLITIRPKRLILDPNATIENGRYFGEYIGEIRRDDAKTLKIRFPKSKDAIDKASKEKDGTILQYGEWWTNEYVFWTLGDEVLNKARNPHWNYDGEEQRVDGYGNPYTEEIRGRNHFTQPRMPYIFLTVFNLGKHPFDDTSLIEQNISKQDLVNKRVRQIDKNADNANGGLIVSGQAFTKEQAAQASDALRSGGAIIVPSGDVNTAVRRDTGTALPSFIYDQLIDTRNQIRASFGVTGLSPQGTKQENTVRGKIIIQGQDTDRVSLIIDYLEQFYDEIFNWWVQLFYVYYDEPHVAAVMGNAAALEYITLRSSDLNRKILVTVKEGSLVPTDDVSKANQATDLWTAGAIDPVSLYARLGFADPREQAKQLYLWQTNPMEYFGMATAQPQSAVTQVQGAAGAPPVAPQAAPQAPAQADPSLLSSVPTQ